jgi:flagellar motility protein MotE (MotC chaperone)
VNNGRIRGVAISALPEQLQDVTSQALFSINTKNLSKKLTTTLEICMRKTIFFCLLFCICLSFVGCKKDGEINAAMNELSSFTTALVQKVEAQQGSIESVDEAQRFLDSKREEMAKKLRVLKEARGFQVSDETKKSMTESITKNVTNVASLQIKYVGNAMKNPNYKSKLEKLIKDYQSMITG